jgi:beta-lactamase superfamily II metal-dependent hydrolase
MNRNAEAPSDSSVEFEENELVYIVFDVGQGSSALISLGDMQVVIDGGTYIGGIDLAEKIRPYVSDGVVEYVVATHCHEDHVGGLQYIYENFDVAHTIYGDLAEDQGYFWYFKNAVFTDGGTFEEDEDMTIEFPYGAALDIYDIEDGNENSNNNSVVTYLSYGDISFINTGDLESDMEERLLPYKLDPNVVVAGHHGSNSSNSLLKEWTPDYFVISCARDNENYHPHKSVLYNALRYTKYRNVYGTWRSGDIVFITDGKNMKTNLSKAQRLTLNDAGAT